MARRTRGRPQSNVLRAKSPDTHRPIEYAFTGVKFETLPWVAAPEASHIKRWCSLYSDDDGRYELYVTFKQGGSETRVYTYFFNSYDELESITQQLADALHPFGSVLHPQVIKAGVRYV
jgi:hypothetical protein